MLKKLLIYLTLTLIIPNTTKISSNNCQTSPSNPYPSPFCHSLNVAAIDIVLLFALKAHGETAFLKRSQMNELLFKRTIGQNLGKMPFLGFQNNIPILQCC